MFTLIIGGAGSGKSALAEALVQSRAGPRVYLAAMQPVDAECRARIQKHRVQRAGGGFLTLECYTAPALDAAVLPPRAGVLLECMSNLVANELYDPGRAAKDADAAVQAVLALLPRCRDLTLVTNEVFSGGAEYEGDTLRYLKELARANRALAARADRVVEAVCGLPNLLKGGPLWNC